MKRKPRFPIIAFAVVAAVSILDVPALAQEADSKEATWYFIGDSNSQWSRTDREPFLSLGEQEATVSRHEFLLTLSDDANPERLRFTAGQSLDLTGRNETYTCLVNRSFDWSNASPITPHFMAGVGMTYTDDQGAANLTGGDTGEATWRPALQFGFGASYAISTSLALVAQYRALMVGTDSLNLDGDTDRGFTQNFLIGARLNF
jgi:opacity protein-like surface antigen